MASKKAAEKKINGKNKKSRSRIQIRDKAAKFIWREWANKDRKKIGKKLYPPGHFFDYMFANAVKAAEATHEEFMQAKLTYQQQYGMKQFLLLLKKHDLHTGRGNRLLIVRELLNVLHNGTRLTQDDAKDAAKDDAKDHVKDEVPTQKQVSKRKRTEPWLEQIVKQISCPLHKRLCKYLPKEIDAQAIFKWILHDVSFTQLLLTFLNYSSQYTVPQMFVIPHTPHV